MSSGNNYIIIGCFVVCILLFVFNRYMNKRRREKGPVMPKKVNGKGKKPGSGVLNPNARVMNVHSDKKATCIITVVTFDDGYTFTTDYSKVLITSGFTGARTQFTMDNEVQQRIIEKAIEEHAKASR